MEAGSGETSSHLSSGRLVVRSTCWNLAGQSASILLAIFVIPLLVNGLGTDRFGVLTLIWTVISFSSLFDLGLGQALTKLVAEKLGNGEDQEVPSLVWTCLFLMLLLGIGGALMVGLLSPWLVHKILSIPASLRTEALQAFYLLALSIPIVMSTAGLWGFLGAQQRFDLVNASRIPIAFLTYLGPLSVLFFSQSLFPIVAVLVVGRLIAWAVILLNCFRVMPALRDEMSFQPRHVRSLMSFGGWLTVSIIISPFMVYLDRFLIGALISTAAVAYYVTPFEVMTKLLFIPGALGGVLLPIFAVNIVRDNHRAGLFFSLGTKCVFWVMFTIILPTVTLAYEILYLWLGDEFARHSDRVLQWLGVGVLINALGQFPFTLLLGAGRPDLGAKLHLIELPFYLILVLVMIHLYGIEGAAVAWVARVAVDTLALFGLAQRFLRADASILGHMVLMMAVALLTLVIAMIPMGAALKWLFLSLALLMTSVAMWVLIFVEEERTLLKSWLKVGQ
jgi:O-antigen/teichoic acid export membrane protein